jgi:hypothetical protein
MKKDELVKFKEYVQIWFGNTPKYKKLLAYVLLRTKQSVSQEEILSFSGLKHSHFVAEFSSFYIMNPRGSSMYYNKTSKIIEKYEELMVKGLVEYKEILESGLRRANLSVGNKIIDGRVVVSEVDTNRAVSTRYVVQCSCGRKSSISTAMMLSKAFKGCPCAWINEIIDGKLTDLEITNVKVGEEWHCEVTFTLNKKRGAMKYVGDTKHKAYIYALADIGPRILMNKSAYGYAVDVLERYMINLPTPKNKG